MYLSKYLSLMFSRESSNHGRAGPPERFVVGVDAHIAVRDLLTSSYEREAVWLGTSRASSGAEEPRNQFLF